MSSQWDWANVIQSAENMANEMEVEADSLKRQAKKIRDWVVPMLREGMALFESRHNLK